MCSLRMRIPHAQDALGVLEQGLQYFLSSCLISVHTAFSQSAFRIDHVTRNGVTEMKDRGLGTRQLISIFALRCRICRLVYVLMLVFLPS